MFLQPDVKFKIIGLESDTPIVQLGETTFKGTKLFFEEDPSPEPVDSVFTVVPPKMLRYKCMSSKTLELSRIFLKTKTNSQIDSNKEMCTAEISSDISNEVNDLVNKTITPDTSTNVLMENIANQTVNNVLENAK
ncbi:hypothetical protein Phum_PHUM430810 [Pediculus humanus corporis]|uniref:Transcription factor TFIIIC triple barrel domain-containing protein n=1 Tax=Pediculus humanus subsp. corporis TaxID=121224 RepID=E0VTD2_PEDHC|nr:uncharacterized protein Phum_PHUM430810 [Pediculus humanus corporis]EEB16638.1 hypothetical protein Phum_PHUM430810 [Pediculus humanus corporis]